MESFKDNPAKTIMMKDMVKAEKRECNLWLEGHVKAGNLVAHSGFDIEDFYVATKDFTMTPLYGAESIKILVPTDVLVKDSENIGDNELYYFKNYTAVNVSILSYEISNLEIITQPDKG